MNTKRRRDYLDNIHYIKGVRSVDNKNNSLGIRAMNDEELEWLNKFNKEFYGASFEEDDNDNLHKNKASEAEIQALRDFLSELKAKAREEKDKAVLADIYAEIEYFTDQLCDIYPKKLCTDANNSRNRCLLNKGKATNEVKFIPWEGLDQNLIGELDVDLLNILNGKEEDDED